MPDSQKVSLFKVAALILGSMTLLRLGLSAIVPVVQDEAYYFAWAQRLAWGYFDHPPLVAFMASTINFLPGLGFAGRLGTVLCSLGVGIFSCRLFIRAGLKTAPALATALILSHANLMGLVFGFLTTPDTVLLLGWTWALDESLRATSGDRPRWLLAGVATGLGLLAKYTMLLIGPVFLWILWRADRKAFLTPWPYLGGIVALVVFLPNLKWNAEHDWITFRFQLRHGLSLERPQMPAQALPEPLPPSPTSPEARLAAAFEDIEEAEEEEEKKPAWYDDLLASLNRYIGYYASQVALWGAMLWPMVIAWRERRRSGRKGQDEESSPLTSAGKTVLIAATAVPLIVFGVLSLFSKVEANWSAMYVIGAAGLLAPAIVKAARSRRALMWATCLNLILLAFAVVHAHTGVFAKRPHRDRLLKETHGYEALAEKVASLPGYKFVDSYQLVSMLQFHEPSLQLAQWPGITRHSEFTRDPLNAAVTLRQLISAGYFWLVTTERTPPRIRGFQATQLSQLRDCQERSLQEITRDRAAAINERCKKPIHEWYLVKYETF